MGQPPKNVSERLWCSRGMIVTVRGPGDAEMSVHVPRPFARIGSDRFAEVCLPQGDLLPCNLYLHATADGIYCLGLSESAPSGWLTPHTRAEIGPYRIKAVFDDEDAAPVAEATDLRKKRPVSGASPLLKIHDRSRQRNAVELSIDRPLTVVGRRPPCALRIVHGTVSRVHCVLYWTGESLWAIDLLSANGTLLDQAPIEAVRFTAGQNLSLGNFRIHYAGANDQSQGPPLPQVAPPAPRSVEPRPGKRRSQSRASRQRKKPSASRRPPKTPRKKFPEAHVAPPREVVDAQVDAARSNATNGEAAIDPAKGDVAERATIAMPRIERDDGRRESARQEANKPTDLALRLPPSAPMGINLPAKKTPTSISCKLVAGELAAGNGDAESLECDAELATESRATGEAPPESGTTESERQLLQALRMLAACTRGASSSEGELPAALVQALLAMVQQALEQANRSKQTPAELPTLPGVESRLAIEGSIANHPAGLLEHELAMISLTLVKARQSAGAGLTPAAPEFERLIGAIEGLDRHVAELIQTTQERRLAIDAVQQLAAPSPTAAARIENRSAEACDREPPAILAGDGAAALISGDAKRSEAETPARPQHASPRPPVAEYQAPPELMGQMPASPAGPPSSPLLDDQMLSRLVSFKTRQDFDIRRRRIFWSVTAAAAIVLIAVATGAAKYLLSEPAPEGQASQYSLQEFAKTLE